MVELIPYHQAKQIIESEIEKLSKSGGCSGACDESQRHKRPYEIERVGDETRINLILPEGTEGYNALCTVVGTLKREDMNLTGFSDALYIHATGKERGVSFRFEKNHAYCGGGYRIRFDRAGAGLSSEEIETVIQLCKIIFGNKKARDPKELLEECGATIYTPDDSLGWDSIAGYDLVKRQIRDNLVLPLKNPEVYRKIAEGTRKRPESIVPRAVLFEGPPGTGKTSSARILASEANATMVYVPVEGIMTKWYGESERNLSNVFDICYALGNSLIFLDEIDSLAGSRDKDMHEATRRVLSVLLRKIDGFEKKEGVVFIGATNRREDLDSALINRFAVSINFPLPNPAERKAIFELYAKQIGSDNLNVLVEGATGFSGRSIKECCQYAERMRASKILNGDNSSTLPTLEDYVESVRLRQEKKNGLIGFGNGH